MIDADQKIVPDLGKDATTALARILWRTWKDVPGADVPPEWKLAKPHFMKEARKLLIAMERNGMTVLERESETMN